MDQDSDALIYFANDDAARTRARDFFNNNPAMNDVRTIRSEIEAGLDRFAGVFFPGGHAPIVDVMQDPDAGEVLRYFQRANKPTAAICHGPISILAALDNAWEFRAALIEGGKVKAHALVKNWQYARLPNDRLLAQRGSVCRGECLPQKANFQHARCAQSRRS